jgi:hypothetical protein
VKFVLHVHDDEKALLRRTEWGILVKCCSRVVESGESESGEPEREGGVLNRE